MTHRRQTAVWLRSVSSLAFQGIRLPRPAHAGQRRAALRSAHWLS